MDPKTGVNSSDSLILQCSDIESDCEQELKIECSESDDNDGINVIIDDSDLSQEDISNNEELRRIYNIMDSNIYNDYTVDLAIKSELEQLVSKSINPKNMKTITVKFQNQIIMIPNDCPISSRLASLVWAYPKTYTPMKLPSQSEFDKNMNYCRESGQLWLRNYPNNIPISDTIGIFSVKYKKNIISSDAGVVNNQSPSITRDGYEGFKHCSSGIYQYCDFALLIIKNGVIIDYAIHGFKSNINECINVHNPVKIFYNASNGDALDVFMNYPYQPFFPAMSSIMQPIKIYRLPENFNSISFCERNDVYCALCSALKDMRGLMFQVPHQKINLNGYEATYLEKPYRKWHNGRKYNSNFAKNQYGQPTHNAFKIHLKKAQKSSGRYNKPYYKI